MKRNTILVLAITLTALSVFAVGRGIHTPQYLGIPGFQHCLAKEQRNHASFWCMPTEKPATCDSHAWQRLNELPVNERIADCQNNEHQH